MVHIFRPTNIGNLGIPLNKMASCRQKAKSSVSLSFAELNLDFTRTINAQIMFFSEMFNPIKVAIKYSDC